ncbi:hypothetical protein KSP39_PZI011048 [Platanthera zijinensis]|uniref:Uncharacterized protein n=1 Tax=Platanthera zijinensis TaxID=2320716 RepID=A0AAP0G5P3_9ASPA
MALQCPSSSDIIGSSCPSFFPDGRTPPRAQVISPSPTPLSSPPSSSPHLPHIFSLVFLRLCSALPPPTSPAATVPIRLFAAPFSLWPSDKCSSHRPAGPSAHQVWFIPLNLFPDFQYLN